MPRRIALLLVLAWATACAGTGAGRPRGADGRVEIGGGQFAAVFRSAVRTVSTAGEVIDTCDADRPKLTTRRTELDAPCGNTICLARQSTAVLVGYRAAKVTITREVWSPTVRGWVPAEPERVQAEAQALAQTIVEKAVPATGRAARQQDACALAAARKMVARGR